MHARKGKAFSNGPARSGVVGAAVSYRTHHHYHWLFFVCDDAVTDSDIVTVRPDSSVNLDGFRSLSRLQRCKCPTRNMVAIRSHMDQGAILARRCRTKARHNHRQVPSSNEMRSMEIPFLRPQEDSAYMIPIAPSVQHRSSLSPATAPPFLSISLLPTTVS